MASTDLKDRIRNRLLQFVSHTTLENGRYHGRVLAVASSKGGVGKTTTAVNVACAMARYCQQKTLLLDLDAQGHVACALNIPWSSQESMSDILLGSNRQVAEIARQHPDIANLHLTPSDKSLGETEAIMSAKVGKEFFLESALKVSRTHYDLIVVDCPPNLGTLTLNALVAADEILIPCDMSVLALEGVSDLLNTVELIKQRLRRTPNILGVLVTRYDRRTRRSNEDISDNLSSIYGQWLLAEKIPQSSMVNRAHLAGQDIFSFAPHSSGAQAYRDLADEVLRRLGKGTDLATVTSTKAPARARARPTAD